MRKKGPLPKERDVSSVMKIALGAPGTCSSCQHLYNQAENNRALLATLDL